MSLVECVPRIDGRPTQNTGTPAALQRRDRVVDALGIELGPLLGAEFVGAAARGARGSARRSSAARFARRHPRPAALRLRRVALALRPGAGGVPAPRAALGGRGLRALADRLAVVQAEHHHDEIGLLRRDHLARDLRPVRRSLRAS